MKSIPDVFGGISDAWAYIKQDRPHRWPLLALSFVIPMLVVWGFLRSFVLEPDTAPDIVYFESWEEGRTDAEARAEWLERAKQTNRDNAQRREAYQRLADALGVEYDAEEAERVAAETEAAPLPDPGVDVAIENDIDESAAPVAETPPPASDRPEEASN